MKRYLFLTASILFFVFAAASSGAAQSSPEGSWTGGFWLDGNWVAVNVRFNRDKENLSGAADIVFPSYGNSRSAANVALENLKQSSSDLHFEIPFASEKVVIDGRQTGDTISGDYHFNRAKGAFGLTRVADVTVESLERYYGIYRVSSDRVISIFRGWNDPRTLNYVDYKTGRVGTLWASSENEFFSGAARGVSFPVALRVSFEKGANGKIKGLSCGSQGEPKLTAQKVELKEERLTFKNGNITLGGTLTAPATKGRHPVVIVTPGDFGTNRNQLRLFAHNYVSWGIATLVFDSRGAGESTGAVNVNSFSDLADDVLTVVQSLKMRADVNPKQIGLFGFSNSAWTISLAASRSADVAFLILQSFSGVEPWQQEIFRSETQLRVDKFPEATVKQGADFMRLKFETARTGAGWEQIQKIMNEARGERWMAYTNPPRSLEGLQAFWQRSATYNPVPALENLRVPVLAYWGGKDTYVPAEESVAVFKRAMTKAGNKNYVVKTYPNGRHDLVEGDTGSPSTGAKLKSYPTEFWKMQTDWLINRARISK